MTHAPKDAAARLSRLLAVLPLFAEEMEMELDELARRSGVSARELLDDLGALTGDRDEPGGFVAKLEVTLEADRVSIRSGHFLRPMRLTAPELCALELGLAMLRARSPMEEWRAMDRARSRLRKAIVRLPAADGGEHAWHAAPPAGSDSAELATLRAALRERRRARITYRKSGESESSERTVEPYALFPSHGTWFLVARTEESGSVRFYRLDRTESAVLLSEHYTIPDDFALDRLMANGKPLHAPSAPAMRVRYSPRIARWIAEREGVPLAADGSLEVEHPLADREWAVRHVLQYGPDAELLEPAELREEVVRRLARVAT
ncbi:MAG TPA: WYL domain-containing protein [Gemmatimonadaceae bacterium]|nr:WYL domain-containing protein [Gemmatimonadaceae bacterium]